MNTHFKHKPGQLTTWAFPALINYYTKIPYRNQMVYNTYQKNKNTDVFDARSCINYNTNSDRTPVICKKKCSVKVITMQPKPRSNPIIRITKTHQQYHQLIHD